MGQLVSGVSNALDLPGIGSALTPQNTYNASPAVAGTVSQQQQLAQLLLNQSQGQGPNPAQSQYLTNTNNAIKQNAGMVASQKGVSPALAARLASENAGTQTQAAAGQAATLQAQQQLGAEGAAGTVYGQIGNEQIGASGQNAAIAAQNAAGDQSTFGGFLNGGAGGLSKLLAKGGMVKKMASGGSVDSTLDSLNAMTSPQPISSTPVNNSNLSKAGDASKNIANSILQQAGIANFQSGVTTNPDAMNSLLTKAFKPTAKPVTVAGGPMDATGITSTDMSPNMTVLQSAHGSMIPPHLEHIANIYHPGWQAKHTTQLKAKGGDVPGKARVAGDSPKNDTVQTLLSPGEVVIPRSIINSKDPVKGAANFVAEQLRKNGKEDEGSPEEFKMALKKAIVSRKKAA